MLPSRRKGFIPEIQVLGKAFGTPFLSDFSSTEINKQHYLPRSSEMEVGA